MNVAILAAYDFLPVPPTADVVVIDDDGRHIFVERHHAEPQRHRIRLTLRSYRHRLASELLDSADRGRNDQMQTAPLLGAQNMVIFLPLAASA